MIHGLHAKQPSPLSFHPTSETGAPVTRRVSEGARSLLFYPEFRKFALLGVATLLVGKWVHLPPT